MSGIKSRLVRVGKVVHPCRVKSFRKAVFTVMNARLPDSKIIEKNNLIVKLGNQHVLKDASSGTKGVILVDRFS